jgi:hypothetical protein
MHAALKEGSTNWGSLLIADGHFLFMFLTGWIRAIFPPTYGLGEGEKYAFSIADPDSSIICLLA